MKKLSTLGSVDVNFLVKNLTTTVSLVNDKYDADLGGCIWVAYCISKELESRNIPFTLAVYGHRNMNLQQLEELVKSDNLGHVNVVIDDVEVYELTQEMMDDAEWSREVIETSSDELLRLWDEYNFNSEYDRGNDEVVEHEIKTCFDMVI